MGPRDSLDDAAKIASTKTWTVQPITSPYADYSIPANLYIKTSCVTQRGFVIILLKLK